VVRRLHREADAASTPAASSHIVFIVRDDQAQADIVFQTSDTTWQAYNQYGGKSLYVGGPAHESRAAPTRSATTGPITTRTTTPEDFLFNAEYPDDSLPSKSNGLQRQPTFSGVDTDRTGATELTRHKIFFVDRARRVLVGPAARQRRGGRGGAGVSLAFFSGNEVFWKTRWGSQYRRVEYGRTGRWSATRKRTPNA